MRSFLISISIATWGLGYIFGIIYTLFVYKVTGSKIGIGEILVSLLWPISWLIAISNAAFKNDRKKDNTNDK